MTSLGSRVFWRPSPTHSTAAPKQVLKLSAYASITLHAVHYRSSGTFWQHIFGGSDQIALTSKVTYRYGADSIEAQAVQDTRNVKANRDHYLGVGRFIALKIPADADGLELTVAMSAVKDDHLDRALGMLNSDEFKKPLELAPPVVGQVLTISSMVKRLFTDTAPQAALEASYPGIISVEQVPDPIESKRLTEGYLIMISNQDDNEGILDSVGQDPSKLEVKSDGLRFDGSEVKATYLIFNITTDLVRGLSTRSTWYKKFQQALHSLDALESAPQDQQAVLYAQAIRLWADGAALLEDDATYLPSERTSIAQASLAEIQKRKPAPPTPGGTNILTEIGRSDAARRLLGIQLTEASGVNTADLFRATNRYAELLSHAGMTLSWEHTNER